LQPDAKGDLHYDEGLNIGYRHFLRHDRAPAFAFGQGLGYARFALGETTLTGGCVDSLSLVVEVRNVSSRAGKEVVQVYLTSPDADSPIRLAGFNSVQLEAHSDTRLSVALEPHAFKQWSTRGWNLVEGRYQLLIGRSCTDIQHSITVQIHQGGQITAD